MAVIELEADLADGLQDEPVWQEPSNDTPPVADLTCEVCGVALEYAGRGRKPKRCVEHRKGAPQGQTGTIKRGNKTLDNLVEGIEMFYMQIGTVITFVPQVAKDGQTIAGSAAQMAESWRPLLERDPKVRRMWEKMLAGTGWSGVIVAHSMVAYAIMANHNMIPGSKSV